MKTASIRELKAKQDEALLRYHAEFAALEEQIKAIRKVRGTVLKPKGIGEEWFEPGRSREPGPR